MLLRSRGAIAQCAATSTRKVIRKPATWVLGTWVPPGVRRAAMVGPLGSSGGHLGPMRSSYAPAEARIVSYGQFHPQGRLGSVPFTHKPPHHRPPAGAPMCGCGRRHWGTTPWRPRNLRNVMGCTHPNSERHTKDLPRAVFCVDCESGLQIGARPTQQTHQNK